MIIFFENGDLWKEIEEGRLSSGGGDSIPPRWLADLMNWPAGIVREGLEHALRRMHGADPLAVAPSRKVISIG